MKRSFTTAVMSGLTAGWMALNLVGFASNAMAQSALTIDLDGERRIVLKAPAKDVIIGNPLVADVTMLSPTNLIVIGHAPGRTRLLVLDADQTPLIDQIVVVSQGSTGLVSVYGPRGGAMTQDLYACGDHCTLIPGGHIGSLGSSGGKGENVAASDQTPPPNGQVPANNQPQQQSPDNSQPPASQDTKPSY